MLDLAGIVALLLWGVHMVQTGAQRALGAGLRSFLAHRLGNQFSAFLAGLGVTALLQSSTATGLMLTSFASEGLVALAPGLAVMLGANVGTTLIVQLLAFEISIIAPILVLIGYLLFRRGQAGTRDSGRIFIGLGLMLFALHQLLSLLDALTAMEATQSFVAMLSTHFVFIVLLGIVLTWASHSSVAVVLLAMSLATKGALTVPAGIALALGANIGTAINPVLEGGARDPGARRLPIGNLLNRVVGVLAVLAIYPWVAPIITSIESAPGRAIANFHTGFNLALALIFLPLLTPYARLLERLLPSRPEQVGPDTPRYLQSVAVGAPVTGALAGATREALHMADVLEEMLSGLREALANPNRRRIEETKALDDRLDRLNRAIKENLLAIDTARLNEADNEKLARILTFSINLEQAGDLIDRGLLGVANRRIKRGLAFSREGTADLISQVDRLVETLHQSTAVFLSGDVTAARALAAEKDGFRRLEDEATAAHFDRLRSGNVETVETSALHLDALRDLKRVSGHLIEASAYPILKQRGDLLPTRLRTLK
ncbi:MULTISPECIES: Na/Pi cotransporter family protein [unclassified Sphingobium]|uniref:Na/Pi cotransporter family protein n=1 Tax=unclassified Sphingobium TaxID=2611147 RepID=UPI0021014BC8|nr:MULTISPECIES: Na/Pi cotransporter family protein [unclassified Sphingobium]